MNNGKKQYIAVDLGAESGRVMLSSIADGHLELQEAHRFANGPVEQNGTLRWEFDRLFCEIKTGLKKAVAQAKGEIAAIGVDSWGVDYGLIDGEGKLVEKPLNYRDPRNPAMMDKAYEMMPRRQIYECTGLQFMPINSLYQLMAHRYLDSDVLAKARRLIFFGDLVSYFLCGEIYAEYTIASTSQMMNMRDGSWSKEIFDKLDLPLEIMPNVVKPGTVVGELSEEIRDEIGCGAIPIVAVASHDTASAVAAVPARSDRWGYISSGTWSLMGLEVPEAIINDTTFKYSFTNEGGVENTIRLLKNIMGLWLVQQCKKQWAKEGTDLDYGRITEMARQAKPFSALMDPDYAEFLTPGDMPARINAYLEKQGESPITDKGQMVRVILENLALKYRLVLERLEEVTGDKLEVLHIVGGGIKNELLCEFTANATGKRVVTGPVEATGIGNVLMQARAVGQVQNLAEARKVVSNSFDLKEYEPTETQIWDRKFEEFIKFLE